ncbi:MAG: 2-succinyl-6-hydroxy-2,4-cyclohexadiene-1-carboxylate synthase, partial [Rivularia sp. (in: cyanobacteria)]
RFYQVILESASPGLLTEKERLERIKRDEQIARKLARSIQREDFRNFLQNWYNQPIFGNIKTHSRFEQMIENRLQNNPVELAKSLRFMGTGVQPALWGKLPDNQVAILLLVGENDQKFIDINKKMTQISNLCNLKTIKNTAHNIHLENTLVFVEHIRDFFNL